MWLCSSDDLQPQGERRHHLLLRAMCCLSSSSASKVSRFSLRIQQKKQPVKHRRGELCTGLARGTKEGVRKPLWAAVGHSVTSAVKYSTPSGGGLWGQSYLPLARACRSALCSLSPPLAGPLIKQKNHFPARAAHVTLPACPASPPCLPPGLLSRRRL